MGRHGCTADQTWCHWKAKNIVSFRLLALDPPTLGMIFENFMEGTSILPTPPLVCATVCFPVPFVLVYPCSPSRAPTAICIVLHTKGLEFQLKSLRAFLFLPPHSCPAY